MGRLINNVNDKNEETLPVIFSTILDYPNYIDRNQELWHLGNFNQDSISLHYLELDQYQIINKLASFCFNEIELEQKCESKLSFRDSIPKFKSMLPSVSLPKLDHIPEPTSILVPTNLETEPPIFNNYIPLMEKEYESQYLNLDSTFKSKLTLEPKLDLNHTPKSMLVPIPILQKPKSSISQSHIHCWIKIKTIMIQ